MRIQTLNNELRLFQLSNLAMSNFGQQVLVNTDSYSAQGDLITGAKLLAHTMNLAKEDPKVDEVYLHVQVCFWYCFDVMMKGYSYASLFLKEGSCQDELHNSLVDIIQVHGRLCPGLVRQLSWPWACTSSNDVIILSPVHLQCPNCSL